MSHKKIKGSSTPIPAPTPTPTPVPTPTPTPVPTPTPSYVWDGAAVWDGTRLGQPMTPAGPLLYSEDFSTSITSLTTGHAPYGAGQFDAIGGPAYSVHDGVLEIQAYQDGNGLWRSGSLQTADNLGVGFMAADVLWETRMKYVGGGPGYWAAGWMLSPQASWGHVEYDMIEWYGGDPRGHHHTAHLWTQAGDHLKSDYKGYDSLTDNDWHVYGQRLLSDGTTIVYLDGLEVRRFKTAYPTPKTYALVSLAINPAEVDQMQPASLLVDYVRAYAAAPPSVTTLAGSASPTSGSGRASGTTIAGTS